MKSQLCISIVMKDLGEAKYCFGPQISPFTAGTEALVHSSQICKDFLIRFQMLDSGPANRPIEYSKVSEDYIAENNGSSSEQTQFSYSEAIVSLMYSMIGTIRGSVFAAGKLAWFWEAIKAAHCNSVKGMFRYVTELVIWKSALQGVTSGCTLMQWLNLGWWY